MMKLNGSYTFNAPQQQVWDALMNPSIIASALPGVDALVPIDGEPNTWRAEAKLKIATISGSYSGTIRMRDIDTPNQYRLVVEGDGQNSIINADTVISIAPVPDDTNKTALTWEAEANISGKLASIGQRLINATANMMSKRFFNELAQQIPDSGG